MRWDEMRKEERMDGRMEKGTHTNWMTVLFATFSNSNVTCFIEILPILHFQSFTLCRKWFIIQTFPNVVVRSNLIEFLTHKWELKTIHSSIERCILHSHVCITHQHRKIGKISTIQRLYMDEEQSLHRECERQFQRVTNQIDWQQKFSKWEESTSHRIRMVLDQSLL
jgi:hypothetical protein